MPLKPVQRQGRPNWYIRGKEAGIEVYHTTELPIIGTTKKQLDAAVSAKIRECRERASDILRNATCGKYLFGEAVLHYLRAKPKEEPYLEKVLAHWEDKPV